LQDVRHQCPIGRAERLKSNVEQFRQVISDYMNIDTLTPFILNKLVEKIRVGCDEKINGQAVQEVTIVWRFAGIV
jgi:hypothetical protein